MKTSQKINTAFDTATAAYADRWADYLESIQNKGIDAKAYRAFLDKQEAVVKEEARLQANGVPSKTLSDIRIAVYEARTRAADTAQKESLSRDVNVVVSADDDVDIEISDKSDDIGPNF